MSRKCFKLMLLVVVFSLGVAVADEPVGDAAPWFSNAADDGGLWTTNENWWRGTAPTATDDVGQDNASALVVNSSMGNVFANSLWVGDYGAGDETSYFEMQSGVLVLADELMIGYRDYEDWGNPEWANWGNGSVTILDGKISVGTVLGVGSTDFEAGVGGVGQLHVDGGAIRATTLAIGVVDPDVLSIMGDVDNSVDITNGKLMLAGDISSLDPRVTAFGGAGYLVFEYEADLAGYTTITAVPEPATVLLLGLGGLASLRRRKRA